MILYKKLSKLLAPMVAAIAGALLGSLPAQTEAATVTAASGDLFIGFRENASSTSYLVKIGTVTQFTTGIYSSGSTTLNLGNIAADLEAQFGINWFSSSDVSWGVFGFSNVANPSLYSSKARTDINTVTTSFAGPTSGDLTSRLNTQAQVGNVFGWFSGGKASTANSNFGVIQSGASGSASYYNQVAAVGSTDFGTTSTWSSIEGTFANGTANTVLDLWAYPNATVYGGTITNVGKFTITDAGAVTFTAAAAVPEPTSAGLMILAGTGLVGLYRRRSHAVTA